MANKAVAMDITATSSTLLLVLIALTFSCNGQQQYFMVRPQNTSVREGQTAMMHCKVGNQQGRAQWIRNGFILNIERDIAAFPRHTVIGNKNSGNHILHIKNATIEDDAEYRCQVEKRGKQRQIQAHAHLTVLVPPTSVEIHNYKSGARIQTREKEEIVLQCLVRNANPAAEIVWFRRNLEIKFAAIKNKVEERDRSKLFYTLSKMTIQVHADDNNADYTCEARHPALVAPKRASITLDVQNPIVSYSLYPGNSRPDPPLVLHVVNVSHDAVELSWKPSFDGGLSQAYRIRYRQIGTNFFKYVNAYPPNITLLSIGGLSLATEYLFGIMASNDLGHSNYTSDVVLAKTSSQWDDASLLADSSVTPGDSPPDSQIMIIVFSTAGSMLLLLLGILITCYFVRPRKKKGSEKALFSEGSSSISATTEMNCMSTSSEPVNGQSLSTISEENEFYSQNGIINEYAPGDATKVAVKTCLIDQTDGQVAFGSYRVGGPQNPGHGTLTRHLKYGNLDIGKNLENYIDTLSRNAFTQSGNDSMYSKSRMNRSSISANPEPDFSVNASRINDSSRYAGYPPPMPLLFKSNWNRFNQLDDSGSQTQSQSPCTPVGTGGNGR